MKEQAVLAVSVGDLHLGLSAASGEELLQNFLLFDSLKGWDIAL